MPGPRGSAEERFRSTGMRAAQNRPRILGSSAAKQRSQETYMDLLLLMNVVVNAGVKLSKVIESGGDNRPYFIMGYIGIVVG